jgi:putative transposase
MLMRRAGLFGLPLKRRPSARSVAPTACDLVDRQFSGNRTRRAVGHRHHSSIPPSEGKLYCGVVLDAYSRRVVGWSIDSRQTAALVTNALGMAIQNRSPDPGTIVHADHGT